MRTFLNNSEADFTYTSGGQMYFELGYKNEISGKTETFLIGIKEENQKSLGAPTKQSTTSRVL